MADEAMFPTVRTARAICKKGQLQGVIVIGIDEKGMVGGASYGSTVKQCRQLAPWLNAIIDNSWHGDMSAFVPDPSEQGGAS